MIVKNLLSQHSYIGVALVTKILQTVVYILLIAAVTKHTIIFGATQKPQKVDYSFTTKIGLKLGFSTIC